VSRAGKPAAADHGCLPAEHLARIRPPSVHLADGRALFDLFGKGLTLLRFTDIDVEPVVEAARQRGVPLEVVDVRDPHARGLYERDLVLIRPDQHVAWRGNAVPREPASIVDRIRGTSTATV